MTTAFCELLISQVHNSRVLWDMTHKDYRNRLLVDREWSRIAEDLCESKETVKGKWKNLRDRFKKELKKVPKGRSGDSQDNAIHYTRTWPYFEPMQFLRKICTPRLTEGNIVSNEREQFDDVDLDNSESTTHEDQLETPELQDLLESPEDIGSSRRSVPETLTASSTSTTGITVEPVRKKSKIERSRFGEKLDQFEQTLPSKYTTKSPVLITPSRKRPTSGNCDMFQEEVLKLEAKKIALLEKQNVDDGDDDLNFFKSLLPHVKHLPSLFFRSQVQNLVMNELSKIQHNEQFVPMRNISSVTTSDSSSYCATPMPSPADQGTNDQQIFQYTQL